MPRAILLVKTSSLGDVIHNMPAAFDIRRRFPNVRLEWAVEEAFAPLVRHHPSVDRVIPVALRRWRRSLMTSQTWREFGVLRRALSETPYDAIIDTQGLLKSAFVASFAHGVHCGFDRRSVREPMATRFYDRTFAVSREAHAVYRCRALVAKALDFELPPNADVALEYALSFATPRKPERPYVLFLHATARAEKEWSEQAWVQLGGRIAGDGLKVLLFHGNAAEQLRGERLAAQIPNAELLPRMPLDQVAAWVANASAVVGVDTGLLHLAAALCVPAVGVFHSTDPTLTGPIGKGPIEIIGSIGAEPGVDETYSALQRVLRT
jgi:heptosyltransferase I